MEKTPTFKQALAELERLHAAFRDISHSTSPDWRHHLLPLRRQLQSQIMLLAQLAGQSAFAREQPERARRFQTVFSRMRATLALHQANWPAVQIDREDAAYQNSVKTLREVNQDFRAMAEEIAPYVDAVRSSRPHTALRKHG